MDNTEKVLTGILGTALVIGFLAMAAHHDNSKACRTAGGVMVDSLCLDLKLVKYETD